MAVMFVWCFTGFVLSRRSRSRSSFLLGSVRRLDSRKASRALRFFVRFLLIRISAAAVSARSSCSCSSRQHRQLLLDARKKGKQKRNTVFVFFRVESTKKSELEAIFQCSFAAPSPRPLRHRGAPGPSQPWRSPRRSSTASTATPKKS